MESYKNTLPGKTVSLCWRPQFAQKKWQKLYWQRQQQTIIYPHIRGLSNAPILINTGDKGEVLNKGYHSNLGGILVLQDISLPRIPLGDAIRLLNELLSEFDFATPADKSRAIALLLTPCLQMGGWLNQSIPIFLVEANDSQTGKGYLLKIVAVVYHEYPSIIAQRNGGVGGFDESIQCAMLKGRPFIQLDNLRGKLDSTYLEMVVTAEGTVGCRVPYRGEIPVDSTHFVFLATSNGVEATRDTAKRCCIIRLLKKKGHMFKAYPEGDLLAHVKSESGKYLSAIFTICSEWKYAGCPQTRENRHSFPGWAQKLDWIIQNVFLLPPLMDGHGEVQERVANPALTWLRCVAQEVDTELRMEQEISASDIAELCDDHNIDIPGLRNNNDEERRKRVGALLSKTIPKEDTLQLDCYNIMQKVRKQYDSKSQEYRDQKVYKFSHSPHLPHQGGGHS